MGVGTGVKAGLNTWRAMRDIQEAHSAWDHLAGVPQTEADLLLPLRSGRKNADMMQEVKDHATQVYATAVGEPGPEA